MMQWRDVSNTLAQRLGVVSVFGWWLRPDSRIMRTVSTRRAKLRDCPGDCLI